MSDPKTHLELVESLNLPRWSGEWGSKFIGIVVGITNDMMTDGAAVALMSQFSTIPEFQPLDALDMLADDCMRPHYPDEPYSSVRERVLGKWDFWTGSIKQGLIDELAAAGYENAEIIVPNDTSPAPDPVEYWSRFWVRLPLGSHIVNNPNGFIVGTSVVGINRIGPAAIDTEAGEVYLRRLKKICKDYKPLQWVVWDFEFEYSSGKYIRLMGKKRFADALYIYQDP